MTEEEAKTKWCPYARHAYSTDRFETNPPAVSCNRMLKKEQQAEGCNCIGSACMAWRWVPSGGPTFSQGTPKTDGYCGLAGKP